LVENQGLVACPSCVPKKVGVNEIVLNEIDISIKKMPK
jgi:hypothetical protein